MNEIALKFLKDSGTTMDINYVGTVDGFPSGDDCLPHRKYRINLKRDGKLYSFPFYGSYNDWRNKKDVDEYSESYSSRSCWKAISIQFLQDEKQKSREKKKSVCRNA